MARRAERRGGGIRTAGVRADGRHDLLRRLLRRDRRVDRRGTGRLRACRARVGAPAGTAGVSRAAGAEALLLDEMFAPVIAVLLREDGHDVTAVAGHPVLAAASDPYLANWASGQSHRVVTENVRDFAPLAGRGDPALRVLFTSSRRLPRSRRNQGPVVDALSHWLAAPRRTPARHGCAETAARLARVGYGYAPGPAAGLVLRTSGVGEDTWFGRSTTRVSANPPQRWRQIHHCLRIVCSCPARCSCRVVPRHGWPRRCGTPASSWSTELARSERAPWPDSRLRQFLAPGSAISMTLRPGLQRWPTRPASSDTTGCCSSTRSSAPPSSCCRSSTRWIATRPPAGSCSLVRPACWDCGTFRIP